MIIVCYYYYYYYYYYYCQLKKLKYSDYNTTKTHNTNHNNILYL